MSSKDSTPAIRGVIEKALLDGVQSLPPEVIRKFEERAPASIMARIRDMSMVGWIGLPDALALRMVLVDLIGEDQALQFFRRQFLTIADGPALGPLTAGLVRIFGLDPHSIVRSFPRLWNAVTKHAGTMHGVVGRDQEAYLEHHDPPLQLEHFEVLLLSNRASLLTMLDYVKHPGTVDVEDGPPLRFVIRWS